MPIALAVLAATVYGAADFYGGLASRRNSAALVVFLSQCAGAPVLAIACAFVPPHWSNGGMLAGLFAGVAAAVAIVALYAALAKGRMGVVSPITAVVGAAVPVIVSALRGQHLGGLAVAGMVCAGIAIVLVTADFSGRGFSFREPGVGLAVLSGTAIGALYVLLAGSAAGLDRLIVTRGVSLVLLGAYCAFRREFVRPATGSLRVIAATGVLDMLANVFYIFATQHGALAIVAVVTSLYPASTVLLAFAVLRERLGRVQWAGVGCALAGVVLIAR